MSDWTTVAGRIVMAGVLAVVTLSMTGCLVGSSSSVEVVGRPISGMTMESLVSGETTETQLLDLLGAPTRTMQADGDGVIYVFEYSRREKSSGHVLFIFSGKSTETDRRTAFVLVRDGLVQKWWLDEMPD